LSFEIVSNLYIEKLVYKGYGLAFDNKIPIFVKHAIPGQIVNAKIKYVKKSVKFADIHKIIKDSKSREKVDCEVFGKCGGCDWLNIKYEKQLEAKEEIIKEIFNFVSEDKFLSISSSSQNKHYRNKVFFPVSSVKSFPKIGMFAEKTHKVIPHSSCKLIPAVFDLIIPNFSSYISASNEKIYNEKFHTGNIRHIGFRISEKTGEIIVIVVTKNRKLAFSKQLVKSLTQNFPKITGIVQNINSLKGNTIVGEDEKILFGCNYINDSIGNKEYKLNYLSFFQINNKITLKLFDYIKKNTQANDVVLDAYCGVGAIGIYLADKVRSVIGIELNERAIKDAKYNAEMNNLKNIDFIQGSLEETFTDLSRSNFFDIIIFDPPRKGIDGKIVSELKNNLPSKIFYISCDPQTQKRDIKKIISIGYEIKSIKSFDMFPQTFHIENVVILEIK